MSHIDIGSRVRWTARIGLILILIGIAGCDELRDGLDTIVAGEQEPGRHLSVTARADQPAVIVTDAANLNGEITLDNQPLSPLSAGAASVTWSKVSGPGAVAFADGGSVVTTATFSAPGSYELNLTAAYGDAAASDTVIIYVVPHLTIRATATGTAAPLTVTYQAAEGAEVATHLPAGSTLQWNFGDGTPMATGTRVTHTFTTAGTFVVTLSLALPGGLGTIGCAETTQEVTVTSIEPGRLSVSPGDSLSSTGMQGGPFAPAAKTYTLTNIGQTKIRWTAAASRDWLSLSNREGDLEPGAEAIVSVSIDDDANALAAGSHTAAVTFTNMTNNQGSTSRPVTLTAAPTPGVLSITPADGLSVIGPQGGPFMPSNRTYTLTNTGGSPLDWTASKTQPWTSLSKTAGTLAAGATDTVTVSIIANANSLALGSYADTVTFTNATSGAGNGTRAVALQAVDSVPPTADAGPDQSVDDVDDDGDEPVTLDGSASTAAFGTLTHYRWMEGDTVLAEGASPTATVTLARGTHEITLEVTDSVGLKATDTLAVTVNEVYASSVSQYGITWTFDKRYRVGKFVTGDWWVLGPARITSVQPPPEGAGGDFRNGSVVNPQAGLTQGYDGRAYNFDPALSARFPLLPDIANGAASIVSTISWTTAPGPAVFGGPVHPGVTLRAAAVLTVVAETPSRTHFRPPFVGTNKPFYDWADADLTPLPALDYPGGSLAYPPSGTGTLCENYARYFQRIWLGIHQTDWVARMINPTENMSDYYEETYRAESDAACLILCDLPGRQELLRQLVQRGIDNAAAFAGGAWSRECSKFPVQLAAMLLNDEALRTMQIVGREDSQTYYGAGYRGQTVLWRQKPGVEHEHVDFTLWDTVETDAGCGCKLDVYRRANSPTWVGHCLSARLLGMQPLWQHDAFFDYVDRWMTEVDDVDAIYEECATDQTQGGQNPQCAGWSYRATSAGHASSQFTKNMWDLYR